MVHRLAQAWRDTSFSAWNAGLIAVFISFAGPMALILQAAETGGLDPATTVSWVWAASVCTGIITLVMSMTMRLPMIAAWSIPGSVLLISGLQRYDISELVGVYLVVGVVSALLSITGVFSKLLAVVPSGVTNGVLAGILLPICFSAVTASQQMTVMAIIMVLAFFITRRLAPLFAVPAAMGSGILWLFLSGAIGSAPAPVGGSMVAQPVWVTPSFDATALVSIGVPLLLVTMAGQNLPGLEMMRSFGYRFNARTALTACNIGGILFAPFGLHAANLATVTGIVCAGPEAHPARRKRYVAGIAAGTFYIIAGIFAPAIVMVMTMISGAALALISGLVLLPALNTALTTLLRQPDAKTAVGNSPGIEAGIVALVVTASELNIAGITAPAWGLATGILVYALLSNWPARRKKRSTNAGASDAAATQVSQRTAVTTAGRKTL